ncbi:related to Lipase 2 [Saccharomycodes ludwigii]|uniref:GPI inositol-deacylase n=1 Tax=Saccharomycodes ludwigii TaxID=36035 RepID=A0A376B258_9ASCO|nr:hypothetical protein SCDLUD_003913 [Saccharomycodes ludwigii]KAH3899632.1 hypothetical protein SCDLUD_003913 [Saccharomycodes ludwigii]SSD58776.1 related to Lipase 2 [Saccharomycodes ludwigii]
MFKRLSSLKYIVPTGAVVLFGTPSLLIAADSKQILENNKEEQEQKLHNHKLIRHNKQEYIKANEIIREIKPLGDNFHTPANPIVLCHGISGFDRLVLLPSIYQIIKFIRNMGTLITDDEEMMKNVYTDDDNIKALLEIDYWIGVKNILERNGCKVLTARVPAFGSIEERANILNHFIQHKVSLHKSKESGKQQDDELMKVNIIAHSMGGLDARYLISEIPQEQKKNYQVCSLTTVSTPHRGSEMADFIVQLAKDLENQVTFTSKANADENDGDKEGGLYNNTSKDTTNITSARRLLPKPIYELTTKHMHDFNERVLDDDKVGYFSYGSYFIPKWHNTFYLSWKIIEKLSNGKPNDGLVTLDSARWGTYMGTLPGLDHLDIINWKINLVKRDTPVTLDVLQFYLKIADDLGRRGY